MHDPCYRPVPVLLASSTQALQDNPYGRSKPQSAGFVDSEVLKLGYYVLRYRFGF